MNNQNSARNQNILRLISMALLLGLCCLSISAFVLQEEDEEVRRTRDERRFKDARAGKRPTPQTMPPSAKNTGKIRPNVVAAMDDELIGVTFWRLSPAADERRSLSSAKDEQDDTRILIPAKKGAEPQPYHTARVGDDASFRNGELLWLGIEVPRADDCFVYVLDREQYADGSLGDPYLIFPAPTTPAGANVASAGRLVYVPAPDDPLPYLRLERNTSRDDRKPPQPPHVAERLTIIVSPRRLTFRGQLEEVDTDIKLLRVDPVEAARCDREWTGKTERLGARRDFSAGMTRAEQEVRETRKLIPTGRPAAGETRRLLPTDLLPHTIYRVQGKAGQPVLLNVSLRIAR